MLEIIARVLQDLPLSHTRGNDMLDAILNENDGMGSASTYEYGPYQPVGKKGVINMTVPDHVPNWIYPKLSQSSKWQRFLMELGAVKSYEVQPDSEINKLTGSGSIFGRKVFGGVSDVNAQGNLMEGTLRHEIGHSVDQKIKFTDRLAKKSEFGGWKTRYMDGKSEPVKDPRMNEYAKAILSKAGFAPPIIQTVLVSYNLATLFTTYVLTDPAVAGAQRFLDLMDMDELSGQANAKGVGKEAVHLGLLSANVPWQLVDSTIQQLNINGRVYQRDHYKNYVSYEYKARANDVSNYQFSSPNEWFAEAYTAYYDPTPNSPARKMLNDATRSWFAANLGPPKPAKPVEQDHDPVANLRNADGKLQEIKENEDAVEDVVKDAVVEVAEKL